MRNSAFRPIATQTPRSTRRASSGAWSAKHIHQVILESFLFTEKAYGPNQLRYDLLELKGHGLLQRDSSRYAYRLTRCKTGNYLRMIGRYLRMAELSL
jgi:hypothetical protein